MTASRLRRGPSGESREVRVEADGAVLDGRRVGFEGVERDGDGELVAILIDGKEHPVVTAVEGNRVWVWCDGVAGAFERVSAGRGGGSARGGDGGAPLQP